MNSQKMSHAFLLGDGSVLVEGDDIDYENGGALVSRTFG